MMENPDLLEGLRLSIQQHTLSRISAYQHYHHQNKGLPNYIQNTLNSLTTIFTLKDLPSYLLAGDYISYLVAFEPTYAPQFQEQRHEYGKFSCFKCRESEQLLILGSKLINEVEAYQLILNIQELLNTSHQDNQTNQTIQLMVKLMEMKLDWQRQKKELCLMKEKDNIIQLTSQLIKFTCQKTNNRNEIILSYKIRLLIRVLQYLGNQLDGNKYGNKLQQFAQMCMTIPLNFIETFSQLFLLLTIIIEKLGVFNFDIISKFIKDNIKYFNNIDYLILLKTFLGKLDKNIKITKEYMLIILSWFYGHLFDVLPFTPKVVHCIKKTMTDIIMEISWKSNFDLSKNIVQLFSKTSHLNQDVVLVSLIFLYQQKLQSNISNALNNPIRTFFDEKNQFNIYDRLLRYYSQETLQFDEFVHNPNPEQHNFLWNLIVIRNTVLINFSNLLQDDKIYGLFKNLIKFVILDMFAQQCYEIIEMIINQFSQLEKSQLERISFGQIFHELSEFLSGRIISTEVVVLLKKMLQNILRKVELLEFKETRLCLYLVMLMHQNCLEAALPPTYFQHFTTLINITIPKRIQQDSVNQIYQIIPKLVQCLEKKPNYFILNLFITLMNKTIGLGQLSQSYRAVRGQVIQIIEENNVFSKLLNSYYIHMFIIDNGSFDNVIVDNSWNLLLAISNIHSIEFGYHILNFFKHLFSILQGQALRQYCRSQIIQTFRFVNLLSGLQPDKKLIKQLVQIVTLKQAFLLYLFETLRLFSNNTTSNNQCQQIRRIQNQVFALCIQMKSQYRSRQRDDAKLEKITKGCFNTHMIMLLMIPVMNKINISAIHSREQLNNKIAQLQNIFEEVSYPTANPATVRFQVRLLVQIRKLKKAF